MGNSSSSSPAPLISVENGVTIIALGPEFETLDELKLDQIREAILTVAEHGQAPTALLVDLSHTKFFGSSFIEVLFRVWNRVNQGGGKFAICGLNSYCREVLQITHLDTVWKTFANRLEALQWLAG
jgi:anti-sigma B factor antagonist